ncbi:hypothetical protein [Peribacillus phoenicis]|uniref:hypothetical protein n=1 Tax=unclassified Peribacillus TaxID=2675266 RepID=UPI0039A1D76E
MNHKRVQRLMRELGLKSLFGKGNLITGRKKHMSFLKTFLIGIFMHPDLMING